MQASANCLTIIKYYEGLGPGNANTDAIKSYICPAHVWTVGWGHALTTPDGHVIDVDVFHDSAAGMAVDAMNRMFGKQTITRAEAEALLQKDIDNFSSGVLHKAASDTTQAQFDAMVSFAFNLGLGNFLKSSVFSLHQAGKRSFANIDIGDIEDQVKAKAEPTTMPLAFGSWSNANHQFALGLYRRRMAEALVYSGWDATKAVTTMEAFKG